MARKATFCPAQAYTGCCHGDLHFHAQAGEGPAQDGPGTVCPWLRGDIPGVQAHCQLLAVLLPAPQHKRGSEPGGRVGGLLHSTPP